VYKHLFALIKSNNLRNKELESKSHRGDWKGKMAANGTTTKTTQRKSAPRTTKTTTTSRTDAQRIREGLNKVRDGSVSYARQTAERTVDVPVGVVLTVADRVNEVVEPFTKRETAERELKSFRTQVERELNKLERRGATSRRKAAVACSRSSGIAPPRKRAGLRRPSTRFASVTVGAVPPCP